MIVTFRILGKHARAQHKQTQISQTKNKSKEEKYGKKLNKNKNQTKTLVSIHCVSAAYLYEQLLLIITDSDWGPYPALKSKSRNNVYDIPRIGSNTGRHERSYPFSNAPARVARGVGMFPRCDRHYNLHM